ncbi:MAG TPA: putative transporter [Tepidisphaeraceae bacterium]|jgi:putative transport protein
MHWLEKVLPEGSVAGGLATLSFAVVLGLLLGAIRVRGIGLGVAAVFFAALGLGAIGLRVNPDVLQFMRDFSLIVFIYTIGLQVGPSFFGSLRAEGLKLNALATLTIVLGVLMAAGLVWLTRSPGASGAGIFVGAFATTPGLAAAQEGLRGTLFTPARADAEKTMTLAYALTYPLGIIGPIFLIPFFRAIFRVRLYEERRALEIRDASQRPRREHVDIEVTRNEPVGVALKDLHCVQGRGIVFSRLLRDQKLTVPAAETRIQMGDVVRVVGTRALLAEVVAALGRESKLDLSSVSHDVELARLIVTRRSALRRSLRELDLTNRYGVTLARVNRAGVELVPGANLRLMFGDLVSAVGPAGGLKHVEQELGNSQEAADAPQLIPIFLGFVLGILAGSIPLVLPGMRSGLKLGLAGGPMLVAIALSRIGNIGPLVWYMPSVAQTMLRDFGMAVFLACAGLAVGADFPSILGGGTGFKLILWGALITLVPMFVVGAFARIFLKLNFITLAGLTAGAMTSSPTLLFAGDYTKSKEVAVAYAAVYPLSTLLPVFCAQILVATLS